MSRLERHVRLSSLCLGRRECQYVIVAHLEITALYPSVEVHTYRFDAADEEL